MVVNGNYHAFDLIALAGSAGSLNPLLQIVRSLPADFPVPVIVAQHHGNHLPCLYFDLFSRGSQVNICEAKDHTRLLPGTVYFPPPGQHILVNPDSTVTLQPRQHNHLYCPSANLLFHSIFDSRLKAVAVILSGFGSDGSDSLQGVKLSGGRVIVQDTTWPHNSGMPYAAMKTGFVDFALPAPLIPNALLSLVMVPGAAGIFEVSSHSHY